MATSLFIVALCLAQLAGWRRGAEEFRSSSAAPSLCYVAERFGRQFNDAVKALHLNPKSTTVLLPDVGAMLLMSDLRVVDLGGLVDRKIASLLSDGMPLAPYILGSVKPTFVSIHDNWIAASGLLTDPSFARDYVALVPGQDYVRRDAVKKVRNLSEIASHLQKDAASVPYPESSSCGGLLFG